MSYTSANLFCDVKTLMSSEKHVDNQQNDTYYILYQFCGALSMHTLAESPEFSGLLRKQTVSCDTSTVSLWRRMKYLDESLKVSLKIFTAEFLISQSHHA